MKLSDKVAYLNGLMDGLDIDKTTKEGKVLVQMSELLKETAGVVEILQAKVEDLTEVCDSLDMELEEIEKDLYSFDEDEDIEDISDFNVEEIDDVEKYGDDEELDYYDSSSDYLEEQLPGFEDAESIDEEEYSEDDAKEAEETETDDDAFSMYADNEEIEFPDIPEENALTEEIVETYEVECPTCHKIIKVDDAVLDEGTIECQNCGQILEFDFNDITIEDIEETTLPEE